MEARWKPGARIGATIDPNAAYDELERIRKDSGSLSTQNIVVASIDEGAVLHGAFEWDDLTAAHEYRRGQARKIVNHLVIVSEDDPESEAPAFISIAVEVDDGCQRHSYVPSLIVAKNETLRTIAIADALRGLASWRNRCAHIEALSDVFVVVDQVLAEHAQSEVSE